MVTHETEPAVVELAKLITGIANEGDHDAARLLLCLAMEDQVPDAHIEPERFVGLAAATWNGAVLFEHQGDEYAARWWYAICDRVCAEFNRRKEARDSAQWN